jgi:hypothetical protein
MVFVPVSESEVTPAWLAECLGPAWPGYESGDLRLERLAGANPKITQIFRAHLAGRASPSVRRVVVKIPAADAAHRRHEAAHRVYEREIEAYRVLQHRQGTSLARVLGSVFDAESKLGAMVFEDLGPPPPPGTGFSDGVLPRLLDVVAGMHAQFWESSGIGQAPWPRGVKNLDLWGDTPDAYASRWRTLARRVELPARLCRTGDALAVRLPAVLEELERRPRTLVHSDLHPGNVMRRGETGEPVVIDWQGTAFAGASSDVAKVMLHAPPAFLKRMERELLAGYHARLEGAGVKSYPFEALMRDYRLAQAAVLANYVMIAPAATSAFEVSLGASGEMVMAAIEAVFPEEFEWP